MAEPAVCLLRAEPTCSKLRQTLFSRLTLPCSMCWLFLVCRFPRPYLPLHILPKPAATAARLRSSVQRESRGDCYPCQGM